MKAYIATDKPSDTNTRPWTMLFINRPVFNGRHWVVEYPLLEEEIGWDTIKLNRGSSTDELLPAFEDGLIEIEINLDQKRKDSKIDSILREISDILNKKQHDYASDETPFSNFEYSGSILNQSPESIIVTNLAQKVSRIHNLISGNKSPKFEALNDSINDLIGYAILLRQYNDEKTGQRNKSKKDGE